MASASATELSASRNMRSARSIVTSPTVTARRYQRTAFCLRSAYRTVPSLPRAEKVGEEPQRYARLIDIVEQVPGDVADRVALPVCHHRRHGRHVKQHRQGAELDMRRQSEFPDLHKLVDRRSLSRLDHRIVDAAAPRGGDDRRIERIQNHRAVSLYEFFVGALGDGFNTLGVVENGAQVTDAPHA